MSVTEKLKEDIKNLSSQEKIILDNFKLSLLQKEAELKNKVAKSPKKRYRKELDNIQAKIATLNKI